MKYVVKSGDTLSKIAKELYGDANRWREIVQANHDLIQNPNHIRPGWELDIPGLETAEPAPAQAAPAAPAAADAPIADDGGEAAEKRAGIRPGRETHEVI